ncbi:hypothetical protein PIB30_100845, partial [Stylosanthes scabra]|nr:hypothetical protein [Stylosanthes scabra]
SYFPPLSARFWFSPDALVRHRLDHRLRLAAPSPTSPASPPSAAARAFTRCLKVPRPPLVFLSRRYSSRWIWFCLPRLRSYMCRHFTNPGLSPEGTQILPRVGASTSKTRSDPPDP